MGHGGHREGAGRPKGRRNNRALEHIQQVAVRFPGWSPLLHMAEVANNPDLPVDIRLDAARAAAPYFHARLKPQEADPDAVIELETRLAEIRARASARHEPGIPDLAERLRRASERLAQFD